MIRRLTDIKHIPRLVAYGRGFHQRTALCDVPFDAKRAGQLVRSSMVSLDAAVWGAFDAQDNVRGLLIGAVLPWPYLQGSYATDIVFCADAEGDALYHTFERWAWARGINAIQMGVSSGIVQADAFYQAAGLTQVGGIYLQTRESAEVAA